MTTAATDGTPGSEGSGRTAFAHTATTFPGVSAPSSVVRSMQRMARSSAHSFESRLIERLASDAARSSNPTASTAGVRATKLEAWVAVNPNGSGASAVVRSMRVDWAATWTSLGARKESMVVQPAGMARKRQPPSSSTSATSS